MTNDQIPMTSFKFSDENLQKIDGILKKYPHKKPAVMPVLYLAQEQNGFISNEVIQEVANILEITPEEVLGVVTFYTMYHQKEMGKYHVQVCTNVSCMLRGGYELYDTVKEKLGLDNLEVTEDKVFSLEEVASRSEVGSSFFSSLSVCF